MDNIYQARAPKTQKFGSEAFEVQQNTTVRWLGNAGVLINSRGTTLMIDPLLKGFDLPLLIEIPIEISDIPKLDAMLITHSDNDHFSKVTCKELKDVCSSFHAPHYVASLLEEMDIKGIGHNINDSFFVNDIKITLTPADHAWQNEYPKYKTREFKKEDYCGFWLDTPDGAIWAVGDSRLMEEQLKMPAPDIMLFDFSDNSWHIGFENAVKLANTYPETKLILWHWGSVDAPNMNAFNGDPAELSKRIDNPERIVLIAPGKEYILEGKKL